jgi:hypothetical protein
VFHKEFQAGAIAVEVAFAEPVKVCIQKRYPTTSFNSRWGAVYGSGKVLAVRSQTGAIESEVCRHPQHERTPIRSDTYHDSIDSNAAKSDR